MNFIQCAGYEIPDSAEDWPEIIEELQTTTPAFIGEVVHSGDFVNIRTMELLEEGDDEEEEAEQATKEMLLVAKEDERIKKFFEIFYFKVNKINLNQKLIPSDYRLLDIPFRTVGEKCSLIDEKYTVPVFLPYKNAERNQRTCVDVPNYYFQKLLGLGVIEIIDEKNCSKTTDLHPYLYA
jgi:hypothetical protein